MSLSFFLTPTMQVLSVVVTLTPSLPASAAYGCFITSVSLNTAARFTSYSTTPTQDAFDRALLMVVGPLLSTT